MADNDQHTHDNSTSGFDSDAIQQSEYLLERIDYDLGEVLDKPEVISVAPNASADASDPFAGIVDQWEAYAKYIPVFIDEAELSLDQFADFLLTAEGTDTHATAKGLLVIAHRLKGSAASLGLHRVAKLAHLMEDLLQEFVDNNRPLPQTVIDALLLCNDGFQRFIESLKAGAPDYKPFADLASVLSRACSAPSDIDTSAVPTEASPTPEMPSSVGMEGPTEPTTPLPTAAFSEAAVASDAELPHETAATSETQAMPTGVPLPVAEEASDLSPVPAEEVVDTTASQGADESARLNALRESVAALIPPSDQGAAYYGETIFQKDFPLVGLKARLVYEKLSNLGDIRFFSPSPDQLEEREDIERVAFGLITERSPAEILPLLRVAGVASVTIRPLRRTQEAAMVKALPETPSAARLASKGRAATSPMPAASEVEEETASGRSVEMETPSEAEKSAATTQAGAPIKPHETVRVDITRLDQLMNLAGQLVIHKARITQTAEQLKKAVADKGAISALRRVTTMLHRINAGNACDSATNPADEMELLRGMARRMLNDLDSVCLDVDAMTESNAHVKDLADSVHLLDRVSDGIQQEAMNTRMAPIGPLFGRFKRVIRDLTHASRKNVRLVIGGEQTELDKRMIDELGDPLINLVRNAVEHGIESPEEREKAGKPAQGTISLDAFRRGNSIVIQISDDGRGLDAQRILAKAIEKKLVATADAGTMSRHDIFQLIWESGLSTSDQTAQAAGRGTGMDIVRSKIADLSGTVDLDSEPGRGTTLVIRLPLTLAILPSLMVRIDGDVFAIPLESVAEIVSVAPSRILTVHGQPTARVRDRTISTISIGSLFTWNHPAGRRQAETASETTLVILDEKGQQLGLVVDHVLGEEDIVIKSIAENYRSIPGVTGASIRGDGRVSLILDPPAMFAMLSRGKAFSLNAQENAV